MLDQINAKIKQYIHDIDAHASSNMLENIKSGKMLRSKLIITIAQNHANTEDIINLCSIVEMIQLASLLHDDVIDDSTLRRNMPSINALYRDKSAIMLGDLLYSKAYFELLNCDIAIAKVISNSVCELSIGEIEDVNLSKEFNTNPSKYLKMCENKTASLIKASAQSAAILAKLESNKYATYGNSLGIAFQLVDDLLDITQDEATLGKPALNDFKEGKTTMPYIYLYEFFKDNNEQENSKKLLNMFKQELDASQKAWIKEQMKRSSSIQKSILLAKNYGTIALESLKNENQEKLQSIVEDMINREF